MGGPYTVARDWWLLISCISFRIDCVIRSHFSGHTIDDGLHGVYVSLSRIIMSCHFIVLCCRVQNARAVSQCCVAVG